jgi:hypothetical protein
LADHERSGEAATSRPGAPLPSSRWAAAIGLIGALTASAAGADALPPTQEEISRGLEAQFQVSLIRERKLADDRESGLIQAAETRLLKAHAEAAKAQGDTRAAQAELTAARAAYAQLAASVASRDAQARAEIEAYHQQVADLTKTADPALVAALQDYADGDRVGAYPAIKRLLLAENAAADAGVAERDAERLRDLASYATEMAERGEGPVSEAIADWEAAQQKSPTEEGWRRLVSLDVEVGQMADAMAAAQSLLKGATEPTDKPTALIQIAVIDARQADLTGATRTMLQAEALLKPLVQSEGRQPRSRAAGYGALQPHPLRRRLRRRQGRRRLQPRARQALHAGQRDLCRVGRQRPRRQAGGRPRCARQSRRLGCGRTGGQPADRRGQAVRRLPQRR